MLRRFRYVSILAFSSLRSSRTFMQGVPEAYVPVMNAKISGIPIDLTMARLAISSIPDDLTLQDDNLLRTLDERCIRSLNGPYIYFVLV